MKKEFNLSDKEFTSRVFIAGREEFNFQAIPSKDVKEFIRRLKKEIPDAQAHFIIDDLAGDKLK